MSKLALSTYWMRGRWERVGDFFDAAAALGWTAFELSGLKDDSFYRAVRPGVFLITSLHAPAPGDMRNGEMRRADILLTSLDAGRRQQAVALIRRALDVADRYGAHVVVLHAGQAGVPSELADQLHGLFDAGQIDSPAAAAVRQQLAAARAHQHEARMASLRRSLDELLPYAADRGLCLGIENRPAAEVPNWQDVSDLLSWYPDAPLGYWHDTGHAQVQQLLGLTLHADWLRAYGRRLVGLHLHDAVGRHVHYAPGSGSVDWPGLAALVPAHVLRTIEVGGAVSEAALRTGIQYLQSSGWLPEVDE